MIGMKAVLEGASVGEGSIVAAGAVVTPGTVVGAGQVCDFGMWVLTRSSCWRVFGAVAIMPLFWGSSQLTSFVPCLC